MKEFTWNDDTIDYFVELHNLKWLGLRSSKSNKFCK